jgi:outer membrane protein OmpA-like peptidoglycan-associated protein
MYPKIKLEAQTDTRGKKEYNLDPSNRRAESVYNYLLSKQIPTSRINSKTGYGEEKIINKCKEGVKYSDK